MKKMATRLEDLNHDEDKLDRKDVYFSLGFSSGVIVLISLGSVFLG